MDEWAHDNARYLWAHDNAEYLTNKWAHDNARSEGEAARLAAKAKVQRTRSDDHWNTVKRLYGAVPESIVMKTFNDSKILPTDSPYHRPFEKWLTLMEQRTSKTPPGSEEFSLQFMDFDFELLDAPPHYFTLRDASNDDDSIQHRKRQLAIS
jgi:hypothetical protein